MSSKLYELIATLALIAGLTWTRWRADLPDVLASLLLGLAATITIQCTMAAVRAERRKRDQVPL
jgi:hypothetical protein